LEDVKIISYNPQIDISNSVWHAPIGVHLALALKEFVIRSQIPNLNLDLSFDHNLCILNLNESCEGTLNN
jgi:hypothetical protein